MREWVGGRITLPVYIEQAEPFRPEIALWLELPEGFVVGHELIDPNGPPVSLADTLLQAMASPLVGTARRPPRIRISQPQLAAELREAVPGIDVVVAPTPELDELVAQMLQSRPGNAEHTESYFEDGRVGAETVAALFQAADALFRTAPWHLVQDSQVMRLDVPALGVEGACVSIIGALGESFGLIIFPSRLALERFLSGVDTEHPRDAPLDMGTTTLSLNFERGADLPPGLRREAAEHGWPVAGPAAYPWVQHRDRDGTMRPLDERDVRIVAACASAVAALFSAHRAELEGASEPTVSGRFAVPGDIEVRLTMPYESAGPSASDDEPSALQKAAATKDTARSAAELHELDGRLVESMFDFAEGRFGDAFRQAAQRVADKTKSMPLMAPSLVYLAQIDGKPVAYWFLKDKDKRLSETERGWLRAQQAAWLSVWEVRGVEPGRGLQLEDLLSGEVREVHETSASRTLTVRQAILARVVDYQGLSLICGMHERPLPPREAAEVVRRARTPLRLKGTNRLRRLREEKMGRYLIARWEEAVAELAARPMPQVQLQNTDGEDVLVTVDRFEFEPSLRGEIEAALAAIDHIEPPPSGEPNGSYHFIRPEGPGSRHGQETILGQARLGDGKLRVESFSVQRADRLRAQIETACGGRLRHRSREHTDPRALINKGPTAKVQNAPSAPSPDEANAAILSYKGQHYSAWPDQPLPALDGQTARAAVQTEAGREQVDLLLKEIESNEARAPEGQRFDFSVLRRELGLEM